MCDRGKISKKPASPSELEQKVGEWADVWCVAAGKKPLAALDYSNYGRKKMKNLSEIRRVIEYANSKGVQVLHMPSESGMYLKTVFFRPRQYENAKRLMRILWFGSPIPSQAFHGYAIGKLLGYSLANIKYFIERTYGQKISSEDVKTFNTVLKMRVTELPGVVRYPIIPDPTISVSKRISVPL